MIIKKSFKNELLNTIAEYGLNVNDFKCVDNIDPYNSETGYSKVWYLKDNNYYFQIDVQNYVFYINCSPGELQLIQASQVEKWTGVIVTFDDWLINLKEEIETPDLWKEMFDVTSNIIENVDENNSFYNDVEVKTIKLLTEDFINKIKDNLNIEKEKLESIEKKLDHVIEQVNKIGKIDWKNLLLGTLLSTAASLSLTKENLEIIGIFTKELFDNFKNKFLTN